MSAFLQALAALTRDASRRPRRWSFVPYDQLNDRLGALATSAPGDVGVVLVEAPAKAALRPYHRQKLATVLTNQRHFALEQAARGVAIRYVVARGDYASALRPLAAELGPLHMMEAAERELREDLRGLVNDGAVVVDRHTGWLTDDADFAGLARPWRMDAFYRQVRRRTGILIDTGGVPTGGRFSFDGENRRPWRGTPAAPNPLRFAVDEITSEVGALITSRYASHPGTLDLTTVPATDVDARNLWRHALTMCLPDFGPFEDAMSTLSSGLFHARIGALLNLHRLLPADIVRDVVAADVPLPSKEGFVRQVLGWREFVRHVHRATDGFRAPGEPTARPSVLSAHEPLPPAFWPGAHKSGLQCLDHVVADVWREGYSHHITRLMVLANIATLLDVEPRELTDWFWVAYVDAFDWVVEPNVLAMGTFATGDVMTTKPYVAGSAYIHKMSDHCGACAFSPKDDCPITPLYWAFLERHRSVLADNDRMALVMGSLRNRSAAQKDNDAEVYRITRASLSRGETLKPAPFSLQPPKKARKKP